MTTGIKSFQDIVQSLIAQVRITQPNANTTIGTYQRDVLIDAPANEMSDLYGQVEVAQKAQSVELADSDHLDRLLANFALYRRPATRATGSIYFQRQTPPGVDVIVPAGTRLRTTTTISQDALEFATTETVTMLAASASTYYNADEDRYEVEASIQANYAGSIYNVGPNTITDIVSTISFTYVKNKSAVTGGLDEESDDSFRARGLSVLKGINVGTKSGYEVLAEAVPGIEAAIVVDPNDSEMERVKDGGGADVWIRTDSTSERTDIYIYGAGEDYHLCSYAPVLSVSAVTQGGVLLVPEVDYNFDPDPWVYARTKFAFDKVVWVTSRTPGAEIRVTYVYSDLVGALQDLIDMSEHHIVGAEVMSKACYSAIVNVTMKVEILPGYDPITVTSAVNSSIVSYIDTLPLGMEVQQSDVIALAESTLGVDSVVIPLTTFTVDRELSHVTDVADMIEGVSTGPPYTGNLKIRRFEAPIAGPDIVVNYYT